MTERKKLTFEEAVSLLSKLPQERQEEVFRFIQLLSHSSVLPAVAPESFLTLGGTLSPETADQIGQAIKELREGR